MIEAIQGSLSVVASTIGLIKQLKTLIPDSPDAEQIEKQLNKLNEQVEIANTKLATELGYKLCQCRFPPAIMLFNKDLNADVCPVCNYSADRPATKMRARSFNSPR